MGRVIAIDYGQKRTGLSVTDPLRITAGGLGTYSGKEVIGFLKNYTATENVDLFLLGAPCQMNGQPSENMQRVMDFKARLQREIPYIPIKMVDERFTSVLARRAILASGVKKKERRENKGLIDEVSATIMLQAFLDSENNI